MKKFKVEICEARKYVFDVEAADEKTAGHLGLEALDYARKSDGLHYHESEDPEDTVTQVFAAYDVTGTDDPFSPVNA